MYLCPNLLEIISPRLVSVSHIHTKDNAFACMCSNLLEIISPRLVSLLRKTLFRERNLEYPWLKNNLPHTRQTVKCRIATESKQNGSKSTKVRNKMVAPNPKGWLGDLGLKFKGLLSHNVSSFLPAFFGATSP